MTSAPSELDLSLLHALQAYRRGDFTVRLPSTWDGVGGRIADTFNDIVEESARIAQDAARVGRTVGKEGNVKQRIPLGTTTGSWAALIEDVNELVDDLVWPTTEMTRVVTAVAHGDLSQLMATEANGQPMQGQFLQIVSTVMCWRQASVRPVRSEAATAAPNEVVIGVVHAIHSSSAASIGPVHQFTGPPASAKRARSLRRAPDLASAHDAAGA